MKQWVAMLTMLLAATAVFAANEEWAARGGAVLTKGVNQAGNPCVTAVGSGAGKGYGGLTLTFAAPLDLAGATAQDAIKLKLFQNLSGLVVMLDGPDGQIYRNVRLPADGTELKIPLDRAQWKAGKGAKADFGKYDKLYLYASHFKHPSQRLSVTALTIEKGGRKLYHYASDNPVPAYRNQVYNFGRGGHNTRDLIKLQLPKALNVKPTLAIVMIGTNDTNNVRKLVPPEAYETNLRKIVDDLQNAGAKMILVTMPPCGGVPRIKPDDPAKIAKTAAVVRKVAQEKNCVLVDFYAIVSASAPLDGKNSMLRNIANSDSNDGVHPTVAGYTALAQALAKEIRDRKLPAERVVCLGDSITYGSAMTGAGTATGDCYPGQLVKLHNP